MFVVQAIKKIFNKKTKKWENLTECFSKSVKKKVYGITISIVPIEKLIEYKKKLARRVDLRDVKELENYNSKT